MGDHIPSRRSFLSVIAAAGVTAGATIPAIAMPGADAELVELAARHARLSQETACAFEHQCKCEDTAILLLPPEPEAIRRAADDHMLLEYPWRKHKDHKTSPDKYTEREFEELRERPRKRLVILDFDPVTGQTWPEGTAPAHIRDALQKGVPWPEAEARAQEIVSAYEAYNRACDAVYERSDGGGIRGSAMTVAIGAAAVKEVLQRYGGEFAASVRATLNSGIEAGLKAPHLDLEQQRSINRDVRPGARAPASSSGLDTICAADVQPRNVEFIWPARLARGKHTCIAGEGGLGKSQLCCSTAAIVSTGGLWPSNEGRAPVGNVIILSAEDGLNDVLVPRLIAAGADLKRIHVVRATVAEDGQRRRKFDLRTDIETLEAKIREIGDVALVIIDPVSSYMGELDSHNNTKLRAVLDPISELAERTSVAFVSVTHFNKGGAATGLKAMHRVMGGAAFTTAPRAAFAVIEDPDDPDRRLFLHLKNNLAPKPQGLAFRLEQRVVATDQKTGEEIVGSCIVWDSEPVSTTADEAMSHHRDASAKEDAVEFLRSVLAAAPIKVGEIEQQARDAGLLSEDQRLSQSKPFRSARKSLGIQPYQQKGERAAGWLWALPGSDATRCLP